MTPAEMRSKIALSNATLNVVWYGNPIPKPDGSKGAPTVTRSHLPVAFLRELISKITLGVSYISVLGGLETTRVPQETCAGVYGLGFRV